MPKRTVTIIKADNQTIILEVFVGTDYRITIPKAIRNLIQPYQKARVTIDLAP